MGINRIELTVLLTFITFNISMAQCLHEKGLLEKKLITKLEQLVKVPADEVYRIDLISPLNLKGLPTKFNGFINLQSLKLMNDSLTDLGNISFEKMKCLQAIHIINSALIELPKGLQVCENLKEAKFSFNNISVVDSEFFTLPSLLFVDLSGQASGSLKILGSNDGGVLEVLNLSKNIIEVDSGFWNFLYLKELNLSSCRLNNYSISGLTNLKFLNLSDNDLKNIPDEIKYLQKLQVLDLSNNPNINRLPDFVFDLKYLSRLNLKGTSIATSLEDRLAIVERFSLNKDIISVEW